MIIRQSPHTQFYGGYIASPPVYAPNDRMKTNEDYNGYYQSFKAKPQKDENLNNNDNENDYVLKYNSINNENSGEKAAIQKQNDLENNDGNLEEQKNQDINQNYAEPQLTNSIQSQDSAESPRFKKTKTNSFGDNEENDDENTLNEMYKSYINSEYDGDDGDLEAQLGK